MSADYRTQVSTTKGEQLLVERQFDSNERGDWRTVAKYMTVDLKKQMRFSWALPLTISICKLERCVVCDFPLAAEEHYKSATYFLHYGGAAAFSKYGCLPNMCLYFPPPSSPDYERITARRKAAEGLEAVTVDGPVDLARLREASGLYAVEEPVITEDKPYIEQACAELSVDLKAGSTTLDQLRRVADRATELKRGATFTGLAAGQPAYPECGNDQCFFDSEGRPMHHLECAERYKETV